MKESKGLTYIKIIINFVLFILTALLLLLVLPKLLSFFMPIIIGWIVSLIANPLVQFLEKRVKLLRKHSSIIIIFSVIIVIVGLMILIGALIIKEAKQLMDNLPVIINEYSQKFTDTSSYLQEKIAVLPKGIHGVIDNTVMSLKTYVDNLTNSSKPITPDRLGLVAKNVAEGFLYIIITVLSAYFFTACRDELAAGLRKHLPASFINYWRLIYDNFKSAFGGYFKAQFKIMLVLIVIMFIGFEILQVDYSFLFALGIAALDFLPVFGTGAILWPWAVLEMLSGHYITAVGLVVIYVICQIVKQVLQPKMVGDSIGLHPLATLILLFVGYKLYGVLGMIIGIPVGMVLVNLYRIGMFNNLLRGIKIIAHDINEFRKF